MHLFDVQIDFFLPVWRRLVVVFVCFAWSAFEFVSAAPVWGMLFAGIGLYAFWQFFLTSWPKKLSPGKKVLASYNQTSGNQTNGNQTNGNQTNGNQTNSNQINSNQANDSLSNNNPADD